jgi:hypothetical protein
VSLFYTTNQIAAHVADALVDQLLNKDKWAYACTAFFLNPQKIDSLKCSDRLDHEMLDSIDELPSCQEGNSVQMLFESPLP